MVFKLYEKLTKRIVIMVPIVLVFAIGTISQALKKPIVSA